jgi:hypothetical protein
MILSAHQSLLQPMCSGYRTVCKEGRHRRGRSIFLCRGWLADCAGVRWLLCVYLAEASSLSMSLLGQRRGNRSACPSPWLGPCKIWAEVVCRIARDLVQEDSPFRGTKRFGMCFVSNDGLAALGTVLEIVKHAVFEDGRMLVLCKGRERFCLQKIIAEKPVLRCTVKVLLPGALPFCLPQF